MNNLSTIKEELQYIERISNITSSMKLASSTNRHRVLGMIKNFDLIKRNFDQCNEDVLSNDVKLGKVAHIILASDQKFCGRFLTELKNNMSKVNFAKDDLVVVIGRQLVDYIQSKCTQKIIKINMFKTFEEAEKLAARICEYSIKIYGSFKTNFTIDSWSSITQKIKTDENIFDLIPIKSSKIIFLYACKIYQRFLYSQLDENNARLQAMTEASENSSKKFKQMLNIYNKARQESITKDIISLV